MKRRPYRFEAPKTRSVRTPKLKMIRIQGILTPFQRCKMYCIHCGKGHIYKQDTNRAPLHVCGVCGKTSYIDYDSTKDIIPFKDEKDIGIGIDPTPLSLVEKDMVSKIISDYKKTGKNEFKAQNAG
jgi:hypothetical protein